MVGLREILATMRRGAAASILVGILALTAGVMPAVGAQTYQYLGQFGSGQLAFPMGLAVDSGGNVYVADPYNGRVDKFNSDGSLVWYRNVTTYWVAVDSNDNVYVSDIWRVLKFSPDGTFLSAIGSYGTGPGQFISQPIVAVGPDDALYAMDTSFMPSVARIEKFDADGTFVTQWGSPGSGNGQFNQPGGIGVDAAGDVYVADRNNYRIQVFDSTGAFLRAWSLSNQPYRIAVDPAGHVYVYVALSWAALVKEFTSTGTLIGQWGSFGHEPPNVGAVYGIAVDSVSGKVYLSNVYDHWVASNDFNIPANSSAWYPSGDKNSDLVYQATTGVPDLCSGGQISLRQGGTFTGTVSSSDPAYKVNVRWHYSANGSAGGWSATKTVLPGTGEFSIGPQAMEGALKVNPGDTLKVGYDLTMPGSHPDVSLSFRNTIVSFQATCVSGAQGGTIDVSIPDGYWTTEGNVLIFQPGG